MQVFKGSLAAGQRPDQRGQEWNDKDQEPISELSKRWDWNW